MLSILLAIAATTIAAPCFAVTLGAEAADFTFEADAVLDVDIVVEDASGLTGLQFSVVYPSDLLAVEQPSTHVFGDMFSHGYVNHDADSSDLPVGRRRIAVAFAAAQPVARSSGLLLTIQFPVRCADYSSGQWPSGRPVEVLIQDEAAWTASGSEVPSPAVVGTVDASFTVDCTTVPVSTTGFTTLKARFTEGENR
jgi:hypothetical protein